LQTNAGYGDPGYGFADRAYSYLYPGPSRIHAYIKQIKGNPKWLSQVRAKAESLNMTTDAMVLLDAIFLSNQELRVKK